MFSNDLCFKCVAAFERLLAPQMAALGWRNCKAATLELDEVVEAAVQTTIVEVPPQVVYLTAAVYQRDLTGNHLPGDFAHTRLFVRWYCRHIGDA